MFFVGGGLFFAFGAILFGLVFAKGGWRTWNQVGVIVDLVRGKFGRFNRWLTIGSFIGIFLGAMALYSGVAAIDVAREKRCQTRCVERGHARGVIGPSVEMSMTRRNSAAFVACTCLGGEGPSIELHADE